MSKIEANLKETKKICKSFYKNFTRLKHRKIVLYGLGPETQILLNNLSGFNIVGLMDNNKKLINKFFFKKKILSEKNVIKLNPIIIIISKSEKAKIIFSEIKHLKKKNIEIFYKNGNKLIESKRKNISNRSINLPNLDKLKKEILKNEIITFDIFDTLISRNVLNPHDIFSIVEKNVNLKFKKKINFSLERRRAENECYNQFSHNFNLNQIYSKLEKRLKISRNSLHMIMQEEIKTEIKYSYPKNEIIEIFNFAKKNKKKVSLITDIYLDQLTIKKILKKNNIRNYRYLLVSCELKKNKLKGDIFKYFKHIEPGKEYLHIGDNYKSDVINAKKNGLKTFHISNKQDLFINSSLLSLKNAVTNEFDLISQGLLTNKIFDKKNFTFYQKTNLPIIDNYPDLGFIIFGPLLYYYISWIYKKSKNLKAKKILFCAREGYFITQLYKLYVKKLKIKKFPEAVYFKTSRRMSVIPSLNNFTDIISSFDNHRFFGTARSLLEKRFGINNKIDKKLILNNLENRKLFIQFLKKFQNSILKNAQYEKKNYTKYLLSVMNKKEKIIISDQGFNGSVQTSLEKITDIKFYGLYMSLKKKNKKKEKSYKRGFYRYGGNFTVLNHIFESVFTAPHGTFIKFDGKKRFYMEKKMTNQRLFKIKKKIFSGVKKYFEEIIKLEKNIENFEIQSQFPDEVFGFFDQEKIIIKPNLLKSFYFDNSYVREGENKISF